MKVFPPFRLDTANQCLWREDARLSLAPKAFAVLEYLVERAGRLVTQEELLENLWPETYVQPEVLRKYILEIRRVLDDPAKKPLFIETQPKRGYRFIAEISDEGSVALANAEIPADSRTLVGRDGALSDLEQYLSRALRGERQVVFVTGEAGIGKTSLVDAFYQRIAHDPRFHMARGQCVEGFGGKEAYYPVLEAIGLLMRGREGPQVVKTLSAHAPTWLIQFPYAVNPDQKAVLLQEILGATRERMVREFCEALESLTSARSLILILEDLQWVDDSTLDLISALARRRGAAKLMILATYRPVDMILSRSPLKLLKQDLLVHRLCHEMSLEPLTKSHVDQYLEAEFPSSNLAELLSGLIHRHSDGNPLFMSALVERLRQQGVIAREGERWVLTVPPQHIDPGVPETLLQMLEVQLEQLGAPERRLLRAASVAGQRFSVWAVAVMLNTAADEVEEICESLAARQQFLRSADVQELPDGTSSAQFEFKHALYRDVLYRQLPQAHCRQLHLRLAERMQALSSPPDPALASELAVHFEAARDYARAIPCLIASAHNATRRYAHSDAIEILRHAMELLPHLAPAASRELGIKVLEKTSDVLYAQGEMGQSADVDYRVAELAAQAGLKVAQVKALTRLARALAFLEPDRCITVCERAVEISRAHDDPLLQARAEMLMACWRIVTNGWRKEDADLCAAARTKIRALSDELPAYYEILYAHVQCTEGDYMGALQTARAGIPRSAENGNLVVYLSAHSSLVQALLHTSQWGELLEVLARASDVAEKNGNAPWLGIFRASLAWLHYHACDFPRGRELAERLLQVYTEAEPGQVQTMAMVTAGYCDLESGAPDRALDLFARICDRPVHPRFFFDWYWRMIARLGLANAWLAKGELAQASGAADLALEQAMSTADPALQALGWELKARVSQAGQDLGGASEHLKRAFAALESVEVPFAAWKVCAGAAVLADAAGNPGEARQHRERAAQIVRALANSLPETSRLHNTLLAAGQSLSRAAGR